MRESPSPRFALAAGVGALTSALSYTAQRVAQAATDPGGLVLLDAHTAWFWRIAVASLHAALAAAAVTLLVGPDGVRRGLTLLAPLTSALVPVMVLLLAWAQ